MTERSNLPGWEQVAHDLAGALRDANGMQRPTVAYPNGKFVEVRPWDDVLAAYDAKVAHSDENATPHG